MGFFLVDCEKVFNFAAQSTRLQYGKSNSAFIGSALQQLPGS